MMTTLYMKITTLCGKNNHHNPPYITFSKSHQNKLFVTCGKRPPYMGNDQHMWGTTSLYCEATILCRETTALCEGTTPCNRKPPPCVVK